MEKTIPTRKIGRVYELTRGFMIRLRDRFGERYRDHQLVMGVAEDFSIISVIDSKGGKDADIELMNMYGGRDNLGQIMVYGTLSDILPEKERVVMLGLD